MLLDAVAGTDLSVVIAGSGREETALKARATQLGLSNVHFLGHVSDEEKVALYGLSRAVVLPSYLRAEAFGITLVEGAMFGKPLISTENGTGTSYVNVDKETGFVVSPNSSEELRRAMQVLVDDETRATAMGGAARARYERLLTADAMGARYRALYRQVLGLEAHSEVEIGQ